MAAPDDSRKKLLMTGVGLGGALFIALLIWHFVFSNASGVSPSDGYFSDDDGKTFFVESTDAFAPFDHHGKPAVGARLFAEEGKAPFVGYLERYTDAGKVRAKELLAERARGDGQPGVDAVLLANMELKRPGDSTWIKASDPKAPALRKVMCPGDPSRPATPYLPPPR